MRIKLIIIVTLVLSVIAVAIVLGFSYLQSVDNRTKANVNESPISLETANITDSSITVIWKTADETIGKVNLYGSGGKAEVMLDNRDITTTANSNKRKIHFVTLKNLTALTKYTFTILSNDKEYFNNTLRWDFTTLKTLSSPLVPKPIYGQANVDSGGAKEILIKMIAKTLSGDSLILASLSTEIGTYSFDLSSLRTGSGEVLNLTAKDQLVITMSAENNKQAQIIANIK